jgi:hypothetical protein
MKIDIEGAEHQLSIEKEELGKAEWMIGELHWGHLEPNHGFEELVMQFKHCQFFEPRITVGTQDGFRVAVDFHALRHNAVPE